MAGESYIDGYCEEAGTALWNDNMPTGRGTSNERMRIGRKITREDPDFESRTKNVLTARMRTAREMTINFGGTGRRGKMRGRWKVTDRMESDKEMLIKMIRSKKPDERWYAVRQFGAVLFCSEVGRSGLHEAVRWCGLIVQFDGAVRWCGLTMWNSNWTRNVQTMVIVRSKNEVIMRHDLIVFFFHVVNKENVAKGYVIGE